mmetsp:Transcript_26697/g.40723  ORF Transcript_26697/g.40723 Transcript_26697/m.40723 type:complete len:147 (+) Transcript_26697:704-1144(+)
MQMHRYHGECPITSRKKVPAFSYFENNGLAQEVLPASDCWSENDEQEYYFILNEVMVSEKEVSQVSLYRLTVNGRDLGKFKSSGILIATGTGSTGWLYSAKQISPHQVNLFKKVLGLKHKNDPNLDPIDYKISKKLSDKTIFAQDS